MSIRTAFIALALWSASTFAADWNLQSLMSQLAVTESSSVRFTETKHLAVLKAPLELRGTLRFRRPDYLERRVEAPFEERFVVEGDRVTLERKVTGERHQLSLRSQPALWAFIESIRATLRGDLATLERFYRVDLHGEPNSWTINLLPRDVEMGKLVSVIRMSGTGGELRTIEVLEASGDRSVTHIEAAR